MKKCESKITKIKDEVFLILYKDFPISLDSMKKVNAVFQKYEAVNS